MNTNTQASDESKGTLGQPQMDQSHKMELDRSRAEGHTTVRASGAVGSGELAVTGAPLTNGARCGAQSDHPVYSGDMSVCGIVGSVGERGLAETSVGVRLGALRGDKGRVIIFTGPMFAGKTTRLLKVVQKRRRDGQGIILVKARVDGRYHERKVVTHDGSLSEEADQVVEKLEEVDVAAQKIICIDELHFYPDAIPLLKRWQEQGVDVYATTVAQGFDGERMPVLTGLEEAGVELLEDFTPADCDLCGAEGSALFTSRLTPLGASPVGGKGVYAAACSSCHSKHHVFSSPTALLADPYFFNLHLQLLLDITQCDLPRWCRAVQAAVLSLEDHWDLWAATCPGCSQIHLDEREYAIHKHSEHLCEHCGLIWQSNRRGPSNPLALLSPELSGGKLLIRLPHSSRDSTTSSPSPTSFATAAGEKILVVAGAKSLQLPTQVQFSAPIVEQPLPAATPRLEAPSDSNGHAQAALEEMRALHRAQMEAALDREQHLLERQRAAEQLVEERQKRQEAKLEQLTSLVEQLATRPRSPPHPPPAGVMEAAIKQAVSSAVAAQEAQLSELKQALMRSEQAAAQERRIAADRAAYTEDRDQRNLELGMKLAALERQLQQRLQAEAEASRRSQQEQARWAEEKAALLVRVAALQQGTVPTQAPGAMQTPPGFPAVSAGAEQAQLGRAKADEWQIPASAGTPPSSLSIPPTTVPSQPAHQTAQTPPRRPHHHPSPPPSPSASPHISAVSTRPQTSRQSTLLPPVELDVKAWGRLTQQISALRLTRLHPRSTYDELQVWQSRVEAVVGSFVDPYRLVARQVWLLMLHTLQDEWWTTLDRSGVMPLQWGPLLEHLQNEEFYFDTRTLRQALEQIQQGQEEPPKQFAHRFSFLWRKSQVPDWLARDFLLRALKGSTKTSVQTALDLQYQRRLEAEPALTLADFMEQQTPQQLLALLQRQDVSKYFQRPVAELGLDRKAGKIRQNTISAPTASTQLPTSTPAPNTIVSQKGKQRGKRGGKQSYEAAERGPGDLQQALGLQLDTLRPKQGAQRAVLGAEEQTKQAKNGQKKSCKKRSSKGGKRRSQGSSSTSHDGDSMPAGLPRQHMTSVPAGAEKLLQERIGQFAVASATRQRCPGSQLILDQPLQALQAMAGVWRQEDPSSGIDRVAQWVEDRLVNLGERHPSIMAYAGELQAARKAYQPQSLFDVARAFSRRMPLGRLVEVEPAVRPYLASLLVAAVDKAGEILKVPASLRIEQVTQDDFEAHLLQLAASSYPHYGMLQSLHNSTQKSAEQLRAEMEVRRDAQQLSMLKELGTLGQTVRAIEEVIRERQAATPEMQMWENESVTGPQAVFSAEQRALIGQVEASLTTTGPNGRDPHELMCTLRQIQKPSRGLHSHPVIHAPQLRPIDNQPHVRAAVGSCKNPGQAWALVDTGACFTMILERVAEMHGIRIYPFRGTFQQADTTSTGEIVGKCAFTLQLSEELLLDLTDVKVQPGSNYSIILGCDILDSAGGSMETSVHLGKSMDLRVGSLTHHIPLYSYASSTFNMRNLASRASYSTSPNQPAANAFPPISSSAGRGTLGPLPGPPPLPQEQQQHEQQLVSLTTTVLTRAQLGDLDKLVEKRAEMVQEFQTLPWGKQDAFLEREKAFLAAAREWLRQQRVPGALAYALGRCLWHRNAQACPSITKRVATCITAFEAGGPEAVNNQLKVLGLATEADLADYKSRAGAAQQPAVRRVVAKSWGKRMQPGQQGIAPFRRV